MQKIENQKVVSNEELMQKLAKSLRTEKSSIVQQYLNDCRIDDYTDTQQFTNLLPVIKLGQMDNLIHYLKHGLLNLDDYPAIRKQLLNDTLSGSNIYDFLLSHRAYGFEHDDNAYQNFFADLNEYCNQLSTDDLFRIHLVQQMINKLALFIIDRKDLDDVNSQINDLLLALSELLNRGAVTKIVIDDDGKYIADGLASNPETTILNLGNAIIASDYPYHVSADNIAELNSLLNAWNDYLAGEDDIDDSNSEDDLLTPSEKYELIDGLRSCDGVSWINDEYMGKSIIDEIIYDVAEKHQIDSGADFGYLFGVAEPLVSQEADAEEEMHQKYAKRALKAFHDGKVKTITQYEDFADKEEACFADEFRKKVENFDWETVQKNSINSLLKAVAPAFPNKSVSELRSKLSELYPDCSSYDASTDEAIKKLKKVMK